MTDEPKACGYCGYMNAHARSCPALEIEGLERELSSSKQEHSLCADVRNGMMEELAEARKEIESIKHNASHIRCEAHKMDASNAWGCPGCVEELRDDLHKEQGISEGLRAELDRRKLKWQTGKPPSSRHVYVIEVKDDTWRPTDRCASRHSDALKQLRLERGWHPEMQFRVRRYTSEAK